MNWLSRFLYPTQPAATVADVPVVIAPTGQLPQKLSTFTRPEGQQANFRKVIDGFSHALATMKLHEGTPHYIGFIELLPHGKAGVRLAGFSPVLTSDGTVLEFFERSGDVAFELEQLTAWTMKEMGVDAFIKGHLDELFADGRRPMIAIWYSHARDPVVGTRLHKDEDGKAIFTCLHYDTDRDAEGPELTFNDASVEKVLDKNPNNLPPSIIEKLRAEHQSLRPADTIHESTIDPNGSVFFNNILLSHSTPGPRSRGIDPSLLKKCLPEFFEGQGSSVKQAYERCMRVREARLLPEGLSQADRQFLLDSPINQVVDVVEMSIFDKKPKIYIDDFASQLVPDELVRPVFAHAGIESLDRVQVGNQLMPVGDRMKRLVRERSATLEQHGKQPLQEVPKRPPFIGMEFKL